MATRQGVAVVKKEADDDFDEPLEHTVITRQSKTVYIMANSTVAEKCRLFSV